MKKVLFIGLLSAAALGLSGCMGKKTVVKKSTKKVASKSLGTGVPLARYTPGDKRFWDDRVEAFVLEEDDKDQRYAPKTAYAKHVSSHEQEWEQESKEDDSFEPVYFSYDDYSIRRDQEPVVQYNTEQAKSVVKSGKIVRVEGHSDKKCISGTYNMAVSQKRATAVSSRLASAGIPQEQIKVVGYGDSKVAVDVSGKEQKNRRVEFATLVS
jgi:outer membrane protein OmpA-like peptidoglycan-associated protein